MQNSKLVKMLRLLTQDEMEQFIHFVESPYFCGQKNLVTFLKKLGKYHPAFDSPAIEKPRHLQTFFPGESKKTAEGRLNQFMHQLAALLDTFFATQQLRSDPAMMQLSAIEMLVKKTANADFPTDDEQGFKTLKGFSTTYIDKKIEQAETTLQQSGYSERQQQQLATLSGLKWDNEVNKNAHATGNELLEKSNSLDASWCYSKLRVSYEMVERNSVLGTKYNPPFLNELLKFLEAHTVFSENAGIRFFRDLFLLREKNDETIFQNLLASLDENSDYFAKDELKNLYDYLENHCSRHAMGASDVEKRAVFHRKLFDLYRQKQHLGIFLENGRLSEQDYKNLVTVGCRAGEFAWVKKMLNENKKVLSPAIREAAFSYNMAYLLHAQGDYKSAWEQLKSTEKVAENLFYELDYRALTLRICYELSGDYLYFQHFIAAKDACLKYLDRRQEGDSKKVASHKSFIRFISALERIKNGKARNIGSKADALLEKMAKTHAKQAVAYITWLRKKVLELGSIADSSD